MGALTDALQRVVIVQKKKAKHKTNCKKEPRIERERTHIQIAWCMPKKKSDSRKKGITRLDQTS